MNDEKENILNLHSKPQQHVHPKIWLGNLKHLGS